MMHKWLQSFQRLLWELICLVICLLILNACCVSRPQSPCHKSKNISSHKPLPQVKKKILEVRGGHYLEGLHPRMKSLAHVFYEKAEQIGIDIRFISGYRKYRAKKRVKKGGSLASWHNLGLAFDINLVGRKGMKGALKYWDDDKKDWHKLGSLAKDLGLTWGLAWGKKEVFHFEWHPGYPDAIRKKTFRSIQRKTDSQIQGYQKFWKYVKP
jgi:hypothetical protein